MDTCHIFTENVIIFYGILEHIRVSLSKPHLVLLLDKMYICTFV